MKTRLRGRLIVPATLAVTVIACSSTPTHENNDGGGSSSGTGAGSTSSHGTGAGSTTSAGTGAGSTSGTGAGSTSGTGAGSTSGTGAGSTGGAGGGFTSGPGTTVGPTSTGAGGGAPCQPVPIADAGVLTYECEDGRMCSAPDPSAIDAGGPYQVCPGYMDCATLVSYDGGAMLGYC